ncbi:hypothetical protein GQ53DRAFT_822620 [Thozetella sp. PMI_491]|nr:hypothetical protein GQ53DRAFT_822620 [Thozetella sp. PMI_491]
MCGACGRHGTDCQFETATDETRSQAVNRKISQLRDDISVQNELIDLLRERPARDVGTIIQRLKAGQDVGSIVNFVKDGDLLLQSHLRPPADFRYQIPFPFESSWMCAVENRYANSNLYRYMITPASLPPEGSGRLTPFLHMYRMPYHFAKLIEPRIGSVKASMWTNVTDSDELVQTTLETYFIHEFPSTFFFHKDLFLQDMAAGRKRYCSSLLVNAILACGWHGLSRATDRASYWKPQSLGYQFLAEAKRLWELQYNKSQLTTVQAGALSAWLDLIRKMGVNTMSGDGPSSCRKTVCTITAWAVYSWQSIQTFYLRRESIMAEPPLLPLPSYQEASAFFGEIWVQYPMVESPVPYGHGQIACAHIGIRAILNRIGLCRYGMEKNNAKFSVNQTLGFHSDLQQWYDSLPSQLTAEQAILPSHLSLHLYYYIALIQLYLPYRFIKPIELEMGQPSTSPETVISDAISCIGTIVQLYYSRHGFEYLDNAVAVLLASIGGIFLDEFSRGASPSTPGADKLATALLCVKGLHDQSKCYLLAEAFFWLLRDRLPQESRGVTSFFRIEEEDEEERRKELAQHIHSDWPIDATSTAEGLDNRRLDGAMRLYASTSSVGSPACSNSQGESL